MGNKLSNNRDIHNIQATTARQDESIAELRQGLENIQNAPLPEDTMRDLQQQIAQSHADNTQQRVEATINQAVGLATTKLQQQNDQSQAIIREEVRSATTQQNDRMSAIEREMDNKLNLAKEERKRAEADMKRSIVNGDKKLEAFKLKMDIKHKTMENKIKQQQELMQMKLRQQQEILDKQMSHTKECADKKLELLHRLKEMKAVSTPEEYDQALKVLTLETPVPPTAYESNDLPVCTDELERDWYYNEEDGSVWFDHVNRRHSTSVIGHRPSTLHL